MISCLWDCLKRIPWWAWIVLALAAAAIAALIYFTGGVAALAALGLSLLAQSILVGIGATFGSTLLYCFQDCVRK
jgi:hypothetical protein